MAKLDNVLRLVLVEDSVEDAEQSVSILRNAGLAVRPVRAEDADQLDEALSAQQLDMVLVNARAKRLRLDEVVARVGRSGKDLTIVLLAERLDPVEMLTAMKHGARAVTLRHPAELLQLTIRRELESLRARRGLRRLETALRDSERRAKMLMDSSREPIAYVHEGMHVYANKAYLEMFSIESFEDIEGTPILDMVSGKDAEIFKGVLKQISKGEKPPERLSLKARRVDGSTFDAVMELSEATVDGEPCTQMIFRQQTVSAELAEQLDTLKRQDLMSGLLNRPTFTTALEDAVAAAVNGQTDQALVYFEIDDYQKHLDTVGVGGADLLLGQIGALIRAQLGPEDQAGRVSDSGFGVIWARRSHESCVEVTHKLQKALSDEIFEAGRQSLSLNGSFGVCLLTEKIANANEVLQRAVDACRTVQKNGGNGIQVNDPAAQEKADEAELQGWMQRFKNALTRDGFELYFQPIVSLIGEPGEYYEILLRMLDDKRQLVMPGTFFPIAERLGVVAHIDRWVIAHAIGLIADRARRGIHTSLYLKIMPQTIEDGSILPWLAQRLRDARIPGERLIFEMPESMVVTNLKPARVFVTGLQQLHCRFALEQFGSGLNSFQLLKHIPADILKLDRSFMADLAKSKENQAKIRELTEQARNLGKITVAEQVEDAASMTILFSNSVHYVQGNFLALPDRDMSYDFGL
jgi:diguanylate cyclase (GGDEF)-like protein/PAS domain S-box-containing protein